VLFDTHVSELAGFEDFAALQTFHVFGILIATYYLDAGMFAGLALACIGNRWRLLGGHKSGKSMSAKGGGNSFTGISGILDLLWALSSAEVPQA